MDVIEGDWKRLGRRVKEERLRRGMTQRQLCAAAGVKRTTFQGLEKGRREPKREPGSVHRVAAYLGWAPGSVERVLAGGDPTYLGGGMPDAGDGSRLESAAAAADPLVAALPPSVAVLLHDSVVDEHLTVPLLTGRTLVSLVTAVRRPGERATPQQLRTEAAEWEAIKTRLEEPIAPETNTDA